MHAYLRFIISHLCNHTLWYFLQPGWWRFWKPKMAVDGRECSISIGWLFRVPACNFQGCILGLHNTFPLSWFHSMATWRFLSGQKSQTEQVHLPIVIHRMKIIPVVRRPSDHFEQVSQSRQEPSFFKPLLNLHTLALPFKVLSSPAPKLRRDRKVKMDRKGFCGLCFGLELWIWWRSRWKTWMMNSLLQTKSN